MYHIWQYNTAPCKIFHRNQSCLSPSIFKKAIYKHTGTVNSLVDTTMFDPTTLKATPQHQSDTLKGHHGKTLGQANILQ